MTDRITTLDISFGYGVSTEQRNKVLRNTYWLLALSLVPTLVIFLVFGRRAVNAIQFTGFR